MATLTNGTSIQMSSQGSRIRTEETSIVTKYTVIYNRNTGVGEMKDVNSPYNNEDTVIVMANIFTKENYEFDGWNTLPDGTGTNYYPGDEIQIIHSIVLYAKWIRLSVTVSIPVIPGVATQMLMISDSIVYEGVGGTNIDVLFGSSVSLFASPSTGYDNPNVNSPIIANDNFSTLTYITAGSKLTRTVFYNANGGSGTMSSQTVSYGESVVLTNNLFTRAGYNFMGWAISPTEPNIYPNGGTITNIITNIILYAKWTNVSTKLTVSYDANGGTTTITDSNEYFSDASVTVIFTPAPIREGYTFLGWAPSILDTEPVYESDELTVFNITSNTTLYAVWRLTNEILLSIQPSKLVATADEEVASAIYIGIVYRNGGSSQTTNIPILLGETEGEVVVSSVSEILGTSVIPKWDDDYYYNLTIDEAGFKIISYNSNTGTGSMANQQAVSGGNATLRLNTFSKIGYTFAGWATSSEGDVVYSNGAIINNITADIELFAKWTVISYRVEFKLNGGTHTGGGPLVQNISYNGTAILPLVSREGFTFNGWDGQYTNITSARDINAIWIALPTFTVSFNANSGLFPTTGAFQLNITKVEGSLLDYETYPLEYPTRAGYVFFGWWTAASGGTNISMPHTVIANRLFYAQWVAAVQLIFDSRGGTPVSTITLQAGTVAQRPADPEKNGYSFLGWSETLGGGIIISWPYRVDNTIKIYAIWAADTYTITFDSNGGSSVASKTAASGNSITAPTPPTKAQYLFVGWFTSASGGTQISFPYTVTSSKTFYAQWIFDPAYTTYTVTYDSQGGSSVPAQTVYVTDNYITAPTPPTKTGYTFAGWYTAASGGTAVTWPYEVIADITFYAHWTVPKTNNFISVQYSGSNVYARSAYNVTSQVNVTLTSDDEQVQTISTISNGSRNGNQSGAAGATDWRVSNVVPAQDSTYYYVY